MPTTHRRTANMSTQLSPPPDGNQNRTGTAVGLVIGTNTPAFIIVALRLYTRLFITKSARWDDWTIVVALVLTSLFGFSVIGADLDQDWLFSRRCP